MHLDSEGLLALLKAGAVEPLALRHLLDCSFCRSRLRDLLDSEAQTTDPLIEDSARRILAHTLARIHPAIETRDENLLTDAQRTADAFAELLGLSEDQQSVRINDPSFRSVGFVQHFLTRAEDADEPELAFRYANLALVILDALDDDPTTYRQRARALCLIAAAQRRKGLIEVASDTLHLTAELLDAETLTAPARVLFCTTLAAVRVDQNRVDEALALLERAAYLAEANDDWLERAKARLALAWLLLDQLDHDEALIVLCEARALIDPAAHPQLAFSVLHALALTHADLGHTVELKEVLSSLTELRTYLPDGIHALRDRWIRAQVLWRIGQTAKAISRMQRVLVGLIQDGFAIDAAVASLEVARWAMESPPHRTKLLAELEDNLRPLAEDGHLPPWLWDVVSFSLSFSQHGKGHFLDLLLSALRFVQRAEFNSQLPFEPLPEPDAMVDWSEITLPEREIAAQTAGLELVDDMPATIDDKDRLAWAHEVLTGERVRFLGPEPA
jgi:tetratricopeptide (TPR) repeat protein